MVTYLPEFKKHLAGLASTDKYVRYLTDIAQVSGTSITPMSLRSDHDIDTFAAALNGRYSEKSVANYRSVMRRYVEMVSILGL
jgi:hypothetical protein